MQPIQDKEPIVQWFPGYIQHNHIIEITILISFIEITMSACPSKDSC